MNVDLGVGLGDDLGGFEGFDELLSNPNQSDFFKFCALEEGGPQHDSKAPSLAMTPPSSGSTVVGTNQGGLGEYNADCDDWNGVQAREIAESEVMHGAVVYASGKPRARKRHEDDDRLLEATEAAYPILKRRASAGTSATMKVQDFPCTDVRQGSVRCGDTLERSPSFDGRMPGDTRGKFRPAGVPVSWGVLGTGPTRVRSTSRVPVPGGAIKVKRDVMSVNTRPRISVFMSSTATRGGAKKQPSSPGTLRGVSHRASTISSFVSSPRMGDSHGPSSQASLHVPGVTPQRIRGLRVVVPRSRSQAEQRIVDSNPAVVAMGSRRSGLPSPVDGTRVFPRLHRASSVGALTIAGSGDVVSRSQVLSPSGSIIQSCELSEQFAGRSQRRNLVCKVFSSGNRSSRPTSGPY